MKNNTDKAIIAGIIRETVFDDVNQVQAMTGMDRQEIIRATGPVTPWHINDGHHEVPQPTPLRHNEENTETKQTVQPNLSSRHSESEDESLECLERPRKKKQKLKKPKDANYMKDTESSKNKARDTKGKLQPTKPVFFKRGRSRSKSRGRSPTKAEAGYKRATIASTARSRDRQAGAGNECIDPLIQIPHVQVEGHNIGCRNQIFQQQFELMPPELTIQKKELHARSRSPSSLTRSRNYASSKTQHEEIPQADQHASTSATPTLLASTSSKLPPPLSDSATDEEIPQEDQHASTSAIPKIIISRSSPSSSPPASERL